MESKNIFPPYTAKIAHTGAEISDLVLTTSYGNYKNVLASIMRVVYIESRLYNSTMERMSNLTIRLRLFALEDQMDQLIHNLTFFPRNGVKILNINHCVLCKLTALSKSGFKKKGKYYFCDDCERNFYKIEEGEECQESPVYIVDAQ